VNTNFHQKSQPSVCYATIKRGLKKHTIIFHVKPAEQTGFVNNVKIIATKVMKLCLICKTTNQLLGAVIVLKKVYVKLKIKSDLSK
jgi:hypothetical protein